MPATSELNSSLFMEEVQKYECLYNKFSKDYKNKFTRLNCWRKIGEKFDVDAAEAEKKYKNIRTAYGRYLKKKKSVPSGSGRDAVPPQEFTNLDWLANHINHKASTVTNMPRRESEDDDEEEERQLQNNSQHVAEVDDEESLSEHEDPLTPLHDESPTCSPNAAANENQPKTTKQKEKTKKKSTTKRAWASNLKKTKDQDIDLALLKTATSLAERVLQPEPPKKSRIEEEEDEDTLYCRSLATRLRKLPLHTKAYLRLQIEQLMYQAQFADNSATHAMSGMLPGMSPGMSPGPGMSYQRPDYTLQPL